MVSAETINQFGFWYRYRTKTKIVVSVVHYNLHKKKVLNGIYYKAVTIPGGKPFAIVAIIVQLFLKATLTTKIMIQAILLPLARTTTFLEFITWPSEIWQGKKIFRGHCVLKRVFTQTFPGNRNRSICNRVNKV